MINSFLLTGRALPVQQTGSLTLVNPLRRIKRLALVVMVSCLALDTAILDPVDLAVDGRLSLALLVAMIACWAILSEVGRYLRLEGASRAENARAARLEGARLTATAMQDRIANKLSLTVGYCEFLACDSRLPEDLRQQAELALAGAKAAAEYASELKRLTKDSGNKNPAFLELPTAAVEVSDSNR
jgi:hypothetical protein